MQRASRLKKNKKLVHNWGVSDADYTTQRWINGKNVWCPIYQKWYSMLARAFSEAVHRSQPSYIGTTVNEEWKYFTDFKVWVESQQWQGLHLDKDILVQGNTEYSSENCAFVPDYVNTLLVRTAKSYNEYPLGVTFGKRTGKFSSTCSNITKSSAWVGTFTDPFEAHRAWQLAKIQAILAVIRLYREEDCYRSDVEAGLMERVFQLQEDYDKNLETVSLT